MIAAELQQVHHSKGMVVLIIRNFGPSIARNVRVTFDPPIPDPSDAARSVTPFLKRRYANPIPTFTPGMEFSNLWYVGQADIHGSFANTEPTPDRCTVTITYEANDGAAYEDTFVIDVDLIRFETYAESSTSPEARMRVTADSLKSLDRSVKAIARTYERAQADGSSGIPRQASGE